MGVLERSREEVGLDLWFWWSKGASGERASMLVQGIFIKFLLFAKIHFLFCF